MSNLKELQKKLLAMQDLNYQNSQAQILPNIDQEKIIGIRSAQLLEFAKEFFDDESKAEFIKQLPHKYFEENLIHVKIISAMEDYNECIKEVKKFLPYVDNWAVCDSFIPKVFSQHTDKLIQEIKIWLAGDATYTVRFAISMLRKFYLDKNFDKKYLKWIQGIQSDDYYVEMAAAWFFVDALIKHYDDTIILLNDRLIYPKIHTKTIQKALESTRIPKKRKEYLKTLRRGNW